MKNFYFIISVLLISSTIIFSNAQSIKQNNKGNWQSDSSKSLNTYKAKEVEVTKSKGIEVYKSKDIDVYKSKSIELYNSNAKKPNDNHYSKKIIENNNRSQNGAIEHNIKSNNKNNVESLIGTWHTKIPGAVWQTPSGRDGYDNLHISTGLKSGDLMIKTDGTYKWNSYGGKKGNWIKGDSDYPIVLIDKVEKKKWRVGYDTKHTGGRDIIIWDGYIWYDGKK